MRPSQRKLDERLYDTPHSWFVAGNPPPLTPPPGAGNFSGRGFSGLSPRKTAPSGFPLPGGKGARGMGLPTPSTKDLSKAGRVSRPISVGYLSLVLNDDRVGLQTVSGGGLVMRPATARRAI